MPEPLNQFWEQLAGRYRYEKEIGRGGMGSVHLAHDLKLDRDVAVKLLRPELCDALNSERFLRELTTAARLDHSHILPVFDSGEVGSTLYYVMPFVPGPTLRERLTLEGALPIEEALLIARQVASALEYAHRHDIVHRDIKPENILLRGSDAVVADFGIARALSHAEGTGLTAASMALGTPPYMSPEQAIPASRLDGRSDLYSLGCVLYEMLAGQPPFTGSTAQAVLARHAREPAPSLREVRSTVPVVVDQAVRRSLEKVPADRFHTGAEFVKALGQPTGPAWGGPVEWLQTEPHEPSFIDELKRRKVIRAAMLYAPGALAVIHGAELTMEAFPLPHWLLTVTYVLAGLGFPVTLVLSWTYDLTHRGLQRTVKLTVPPTKARSPSGAEAVQPLQQPNVAPATAPIHIGSLGRWLSTPARATAVLGALFLFNLVETLAESWLTPRLPFVTGFAEQTARAAHWLEGSRPFENQDVGMLATMGYSTAYFFLLPLLLVSIGLMFALGRDRKPFRTFSLALVINYLLSLPFFLFFPVPERWSYAESGAMLLSDKWSPQLIQVIRPISGLDNCFPSSHVSLTVIVVLTCFLYASRVRWPVLWLGLSVMLSTYVLGIHWVTDIIAGVAAGVLSVALAHRAGDSHATPAHLAGGGMSRSKHLSLVAANDIDAELVSQS